jgi:hypothetical protein
MSRRIPALGDPAPWAVLLAAVPPAPDAHATLVLTSSLAVLLQALAPPTWTGPDLVVAFAVGAAGVVAVGGALELWRCSLRPGPALGSEVGREEGFSNERRAA